MSDLFQFFQSPRRVSHLDEVAEGSAPLPPYHLHLVLPLEDRQTIIDRSVPMAEHNDSLPVPRPPGLQERAQGERGKVGYGPHHRPPLRLPRRNIHSAKSEKIGIVQLLISRHLCFFEKKNYFFQPESR